LVLEESGQANSSSRGIDYAPSKEKHWRLGLYKGRHPQKASYP